MNERLNYLDTAKGIGIILVVIYHHLLGAEFVNNWISSFHMPLFFMITGYIYGYRNDYSKTGKDFIIQKIKGLLYPYFTLSLIVIVWNVIFYNVLFQSVVPDNSTLETCLLTITTYGYHALWFVPCLFYGSVIFYLLRKYFFHHLILIVLVLFVVVFSVFTDAKVFSYYPVKFFLRILIGIMFIYLGYLFFGFLRKLNRPWEMAVFLLTGLIFVLSFAGYYFLPNLFPFINIGVCHIEKPILYLILALPNSAFVILLSKKICNNVCSFLGKNSIIILAFHMDLTVEIAWIIEEHIPWSVNTLIQSFAVVLIELVMLIVMALIVNKYISYLIIFNNLPFFKRKRKLL